jgi:hypothetical protein
MEVNGQDEVSSDIHRNGRGFSYLAAFYFGLEYNRKKLALLKGSGKL